MYSLVLLPIIDYDSLLGLAFAPRHTAKEDDRLIKKVGPFVFLLLFFLFTCTVVGATFIYHPPSPSKSPTARCILGAFHPVL